MLDRRRLRRRAIVWSCVLCAAVLFAYAASNWVFVQYRRPRWYARVSDGAVLVGWHRDRYSLTHYPNAMGVQVGHLKHVSNRPPAWDWGWRWWRTRIQLDASFPLWAFLAAGAAPGAVALASTALARSRPGLCDNCGYDRSTIAVEARCPECGAEARAKTPAC